MMAYSSISHAGFILVAVEAATDRGIQAVLFYLAAYTFMIAGTFAVIAVVGRTGDGRHQLSDYRGLSHSNPVLALVLTIFLLAQAGVPFTSGFFAKFYVIVAAVDADSWVLGLIAMVSAVIAAFLYLRLVVSMYMSAPEGQEDAMPTELAGGPVRIGVGAWLGIAVCLAVTLAVGIVPDSVLDPAEKGRPALVEVADDPAGPGAGELQLDEGGGPP
jgi:NADH-quinone oxidoreductase subunit N